MLSAASILLIVYAVIILVALGGNLLVMSFAAPNDTLGYWPFGRLYCQLWICFDITCTTASILNLSAIALHRFLHIIHPLIYVRLQEAKNIIVIIFVWLISAIIGFTQIILELVQRDGGSDGGNVKYNDSQPRCELRLKPLYALSSFMCSFVIPAVMMEHGKTMRTQFQQAANSCVTLDACEGIQNNSNVGFFCDRIFATFRCCYRNNLIVSERVKPKNTSSQLCVTDQKARLTLGVIMGTFLICWLPFFIVNVIRSFLPALISDMQFKLGYANSTANPIIYTILNRNFRIAFKKILFDDVLCSSRDAYLNGSCG
uniref:G_PROTEIN_RECEP_F1_2 domain-containing protein n=1 Tax=Wuchereria bancrofti TaxID=6293 RepID=A0A1I8E9J9_WUCBA